MHGASFGVLAALTTFSQYAPKNYIIYSNRSMCLGRLGKYGDALSDAKTVVAMMPTWAKGFARLAAALEALNHDSDAIAAYEKARWLAAAHDNDPAGEAEYADACTALRQRSALSGLEGNDGFA
jgi:Flp pilus assembly protein TadD